MYTSIKFENGSNVSSHTCSAISARRTTRSEEHTSELQSRLHLVCRLLLEKKKILASSLGPVRSLARPADTAHACAQPPRDPTREYPCALRQGTCSVRNTALSHPTALPARV